MFRRSKKEISKVIKAKQEQHEALRKEGSVEFKEMKRLKDKGDYDAALRQAVKFLEVRQEADALATEICKKNSLRWSRYNRKPDPLIDKYNQMRNKKQEK